MFGRGRREIDRPGRAGRREVRLDPVRWRRPGRGILLRTAVMTVLLATAAAFAWTRPTDCGPAGSPPAGTATTRPSTGPAASGSPARSGSAADRPGSVTGSLSGRANGRPDPADGGHGSASAPEGSPASVPRGAVGVPVRLSDPAALRLIRRGDRVDVVGVAPSGGAATRIADDALVLDVTGADDPTVGGVLLAVDRNEAQRAVAVGDGVRFAVIIHPRADQTGR